MLGRSRKAFTLAELVVSLTMGGVLLAIITGIAVRQQRTFADLADAAAVRAQIQDARAILPLDLRAVSPIAGDVRDARDTAFEFRATIASAVVCDTGAGRIILAPATSSPTSLTSVAERIEVNDTVWALAPNDSSEDWRASRVTNVATHRGALCAAGGPVLASAARAVRRIALTITPFAISAGAVVRVTRPLRYSLYRASDGASYVGQRDWNNTTATLNTIQPVAGPFLSASQNGLRFTYIDSAGATMGAPVANRTGIAAVRIDVRGQTRTIERALGSARAASAYGLDSSSVLVVLRNRR